MGGCTREGCTRGGCNMGGYTRGACTLGGCTRGGVLSGWDVCGVCTQGVPAAPRVHQCAGLPPGAPRAAQDCAGAPHQGCHGLLLPPACELLCHCCHLTLYHCVTLSRCHFAIGSLYHCVTVSLCLSGTTARWHRAPPPCLSGTPALRPLYPPFHPMPVALLMSLFPFSSFIMYIF